MDSAFKINAMSIDCTETVFLFGNNSGELLCVDTDNLTVLGRCQGNVGAIYAIASHPNQPLVATMGMDCFVCLWDIAQPAAPRLLSRFNLRRISPWNDVDPVPVHPSHSQALCFHPSLPYIATRSGNAGVVELDYSSGTMELVHCTRLHGPEDVTTVRYVLGGRKLASGGLGSIVLSEAGLVINNWRVGRNNVHWFEPLGDEVYLVATDDRCVLRFDFRHGEVVVSGPVITRDDLEHVTFNPSSKRAYVVGFDRNVYEIDPQTCASLGVAYAAPFKMRWMKTLRRQPEVAFLQCFDGGVYKVDLERRSAVVAMRHTPPALWTGCDLGKGRIALTGEGDEVVTVEYGSSPGARHPVMLEKTVSGKGSPSGSTKRIFLDKEEALWLGQSSGEIIRIRDNKHLTVSRFNSAVRDLTANQRGDRILACLEDGTFHSIDRESGISQASWQSAVDQPLWALAAHPETDMVVVGERGGNLMFLDATTADVMRVGPASARIKRAKWLNADTLLYNFNDGMHRYSWQLDQATPYVDVCGNTVEDFIWDEEQRYLVFITYNTDIVLCDLATGEKIHTSSDQSDFSKGLMWLKPLDRTAYPLDFITFGRSGTAHIYRVHNNKIVSLGPLSHKLLSRHYWVDGKKLDQLLPGSGNDLRIAAMA